MRPPAEIISARRIGEFYLSRLLQDPPIDLSLGSFSSLEAIFRIYAHIKIPPSLVEQMDLNKLGWLTFINQPHAPTILHGAIPRDMYEQRAPNINTPLNSALATIEIAQRVDIDESVKEERAPDNPIYKPLFVRIGGVMGNRVVGLTYDCSDSCRLTGLNVSLSRDEQRDYEIYGWDQAGNPIYGLTASLPSDSNYPYKMAAFITRAMRDRVKGNSDQRSHESALAFQLPSSDVILPVLATDKKPEHWEILKNLNHRLGYYTVCKDGLVKVGRGGQNVSRWEISVPERLIPAT